MFGISVNLLKKLNIHNCPSTALSNNSIVFIPFNMTNNKKCGVNDISFGQCNLAVKIYHHH